MLEARGLTKYYSAITGVRDVNFRIEPGAVGRTDLRGSLWNARNESSTAVEPGQRCRVTRVDGLLVHIQPE